MSRYAAVVTTARRLLRNDYLGWIMGAKLEATLEKRLEQMLKELAGGRQYMKMSWQPRGNG